MDTMKTPGIRMPAPVTPALTTDIIIELVDRARRLDRADRTAFPAVGLVPPGGFKVDGEAVERAAAREALEETALAVTLKVLLGV